MKNFKQFMEARFKANNPIRKEIASIETYWIKPGAAISHISEILRKYGYAIDGVVSFNDTLEDYHTTFPIIVDPSSGQTDAGTEVVNSMLVFIWHKMGSGKYEITTYLS